jgi:hypothetical protein
MAEAKREKVKVVGASPKRDNNTGAVIGWTLVAKRPWKEGWSEYDTNFYANEDNQTGILFAQLEQVKADSVLEIEFDEIPITMQGGKPGTRRFLTAILTNPNKPLEDTKANGNTWRESWGYSEEGSRFRETATNARTSLIAARERLQGGDAGDLDVAELAWVYFRELQSMCGLAFPDTLTKAPVPTTTPAPSQSSQGQQTPVQTTATTFWAAVMPMAAAREVKANDLVYSALGMTAPEYAEQHSWDEALEKVKELKEA